MLSDLLKAAQQVGSRDGTMAQVFCLYISPDSESRALSSYQPP